MGMEARAQLRCASYAILLTSLAWKFVPLSLAAATREELPSVTAQSENFVVSAPDQATARAVLARAESLRRSIAVTWLGDALPDGIAPTVIRVTISSDEDRGLTWVADRADRLSHMMWLTTSRERAAGSTLAHEMAHVVLATRYPGQLPAWLDEGIASREDDERRVAARREILKWYHQTGNWPSLLETLSATKIAGSERGRYALSASLTEYLLTQGDAPKLFAFAQAGKANGWDQALRDHYQIRDARELETRWRLWASR